LEAGDGHVIGIASIATLALSQQLRALFATASTKSVKVEVRWNDDFEKYQITKLLGQEVPVSAASFFQKS
jgi:hypothetical protein